MRYLIALCLLCGCGLPTAPEAERYSWVEPNGWIQDTNGPYYYDGTEFKWIEPVKDLPLTNSRNGLK